MGNNAFKDERWEDAVNYYTHAISKDDRDYVCYSNRSAAYLKQGELIKALEDAGRCISICPTYNKGHIRRVGVYHHMEEFEDAVDAYLEALEMCPNDKTLQKGLRAAQKRVQKSQDPVGDEEKVLQTFKF